MSEMIYGSKKLESFYLRTWLTEGGLLRTVLRLRQLTLRTINIDTITQVKLWPDHGSPGVWRMGRVSV